MITGERLRDLPKVELHLHLEGSMRPATVLGLAERNGVDIGCESEAELTERYRFRDFLHFIELFKAGLSVLRTPADIVFIADALTTELAEQNVHWAEITSTPNIHLRWHGLAAEEYGGALDQAQRDAAAKGVEVRWICDVSRGDELPDHHTSTDFLVGPHAPAGAVALGIGGPEAEWPAALYVDTFAKARAAGVPAICHAGEAAGPQSIVDALDLLHSLRIGHGVRCLEDPALVERLVDEQVMLEVSPTSNVLLGITAGGIAEHPFGELRRLGVNVGVNTDDPGYFSTTLTRELELVQAHHGIDSPGLVALQRAALDASFAPPDVRRSMHADLDRWEALRDD